MPHLLVKLRAKSSQKRLGYSHVLKLCPKVDFRCVVLDPGDTQIVKYLASFQKLNLILKNPILTFAKFGTWGPPLSNFPCQVSGHEPVPAFSFPVLLQNKSVTICGNKNVTITPIPQSQLCSKLFWLVANFSQSGEACHLQRAEQTNAEVGMKKAENPGEHQSLSVLTNLPFILDSDGWQQWR